MKPLKFRAWTGKQMLYQDKQYLASFIRHVVLQINLDSERGFQRAHEAYLPDGKSIDDYLLQWTGPLDIAGKEIYVGDIVQFQTFDGWGIVRFCAPAFVASDHSLRGYEVEVVGNIYETPELLKEVRA
jgi:hypothetical protein